MQLFPALPEVVRGMFRRPEALAVCPPGGGPRERGMFLNQTTNYGLTQWEATDRILMEDFNDDNAAIDAALAAHDGDIAALEAAVEGKGNCQVVFGTYTGTGGAGASAPNALTFSGKPVFVAIRRQDSAGNNDSITPIMVRDSLYWYPLDTQINTWNNVTWGDNSVSWYVSGGNAASQANWSGAVYCYVALLQAGE